MVHVQQTGGSRSQWAYRQEYAGAQQPGSTGLQRNIRTRRYFRRKHKEALIFSLPVILAYARIQKNQRIGFRHTPE